MKKKTKLILLFVIIVYFLLVSVAIGFFWHAMTTNEYLEDSRRDIISYSEDHKSIYYNGQEYVLYEGTSFFSTLKAPSSDKDYAEKGFALLSWSGLKGHADVFYSYRYDSPYVIHNSTRKENYYLKGYSFDDDVFKVSGTDMTFTFREIRRAKFGVVHSYPGNTKIKFEFESVKYPGVKYTFGATKVNDKWYYDGSNRHEDCKYLISSVFIENLKQAGITES